MESQKPEVLAKECINFFKTRYKRLNLDSLGKCNWATGVIFQICLFVAQAQQEVAAD